METVRDLFEARVELKKFQKLNPKRILQILKSIRDCSSITRDWIRKTRITKTLTRISLYKYPEENEQNILVIKFSKHLLSKFKNLFPHLKSSTPATIAPTKSELKQHSSSIQNNNNGKQSSQKQGITASPSTKRPPTAQAQNTTPAKPQTDIPLPSYANQRRNQGLQGFVKYFQKNIEESQKQVSQTICVEIEKYLFSRNSDNNEFNEDSYKIDVKKLCTHLLNAEAAQLLRKSAIKEFNAKQTGSLECIKKILD